MKVNFILIYNIGTAKICMLEKNNKISVFQKISDACSFINSIEMSVFSSTATPVNLLISLSSL